MGMDMDMDVCFCTYTVCCTTLGCAIICMLGAHAVRVHEHVLGWT